MTDAPPDAPSPSRRRLSPDRSRDAALDAARVLLVEAGPQAVTLKAVAARMGRTHATLLHHFGSAAELQRALIARMTDAIVTTIRAAVPAGGEARPDLQAIVDLVFDAFGRGGAGALASWMILTGNRDALDPVLGAIHALVDDLARRRPDDDAPHCSRPIGDRTLELLLLAMGDALLGAAVARGLGLPDDRARALALAALGRVEG